MKNKLCSIVVPAWNLEDCINRTLDSVLGQTHARLQCICVDDGSTDKTFDLLDRYARSDGRVAVLRNPTNQGDAFSRNRGAGLATGEYLYFLDGDDVIRDDFVEKMIGLMEKNGSDIAFFNASYQQADKSWKPASFVKPKHLTLDATKPLGIEDKKYLLFTLSPGTCFRFFRTSFYRENGIHYPTRLARGSDRTVLWKSVIRASKAVFTDEILYDYYYREGSLDHTKNIPAEESPSYEIVKIIEGYCRESGYWPDLRTGCFIDRMRCLTYYYNKSDAREKEKFIEECLKRDVITGDYWASILSDEFACLYPAGTLSNSYWNFSRNALDGAIRTSHASISGLDKDRLEAIANRIA